MTPAKGYTEMKDSGIEWIGEIPAHWEICKIKYVVTQETLRAENNDGYIGLENVESWSGKIIDKHDENVVIEGASLAVCPNDILFGKLRPYLAKCVIAEKSGCCSTEFIVMRPHSIEGRFLKYVMLTPQFIDMVNMSTYGAKMPRANWDFIENALLAMPSRDEQATIAAHLDTQCAKIDEIIAQAKASIEDYKQWKASIIYEAVTKGLDPNVEMKDSGIPWIGKIPDTWAVCKTLYVLSMSITDGPHVTPELFDDGIPFISAEAVSCGNGKIDFSHKRGFISEEFYQECCKKYIPQLDDIFMIKSGATTGRVAMVDTNERFTIWSPLAVFRANRDRIVPRYLFYFLQSEVYQKQVELGWTYGTQQNIGMRTLETLKVCLPPFDTQAEIVEFLEKDCSIIDQLIAEKESLIDDLESYKKSLIYEVVTGKRRVC